MNKKRLYGLVVFLVSLIVYSISANPDVTFTDNGELAGVCSSLGVAHPTGYPLFTILGYIWSMIPLPLTQIHSLNIFASVLTAFSVLVFYFTNYEFLKAAGTKFKEKEALIASGSALTYAFALTIWQQALSLEVYSLQLLLINLILLFALKAYNSESPFRYLLITAFIAGLGFANHMTTILMIPALIFIFFVIPKEHMWHSNRIKTLLILMVPLLLGLSFYLYLPLRSAQEPAFNWGAVHRSFDKFMYHVQGKQYQVWMFSGGEAIKKNLGIFFSSLPYQLGFIGLIATITGVFNIYRMNKHLFWIAFIMFISCLAYAVNYSIHDIEAYFSTAFIALFIFTLFGFKYFLNKKPKLLPLIFAVPLISFGVNLSSNYKGNDETVSAYTEILTNNLDSNPVIISAQWDYWCSAFWYKQQIEGIRKDVVLIEKELLRRTWYPYQLRNWYPEAIRKCENQLKLFEEQLELFEAGENYDPLKIQPRFENLLKCFVESNIDERPVYVTLDILQTEPYLTKNYVNIPDGFAIRLERKPVNEKIEIDDKLITKFINSSSGFEGHLYEGIRESAGIYLSTISRYAASAGKNEVAEKAGNYARILMQNK